MGRGLRVGMGMVEEAPAVQLCWVPTPNVAPDQPRDLNLVERAPGDVSGDVNPPNCGSSLDAEVWLRRLQDAALPG